MMTRMVLLFFCAVGFLTVDAQAQVVLEQGKVTLSVSPSEHTNGSLSIRNTSADAVTIKVYWEDFDYKPPYDGTKDFSPAGTAPGSASQWVIFSPQEFTIPAFSQQNVDYTVSVPGQINEGHYGVLFFERSAPASLNHEEINLVTRLGCLFFIEPKNKNKKAELQNIVLKGDALQADFVNQGNVVLIPHTTFYLMKDQLVTLRGEANKLYVPPGASGVVSISLKEHLKPGHYTLVINSDLEEGNVAVKEIGLDADDSGQLSVINS